MNPTNPPVLRLSKPIDLLALVPYLLGFQPDNSLVVAAFAHDDRYVVSARTDLPTVPAGALRLRHSMSRLATLMRDNGATGVVLIGYGAAAQAIPALRTAAAGLHAEDLTVLDMLHVADGRFWSLNCTNSGCCPPEGTPFDPTTTSVAATATLAGVAVLPSRQALAATLTPVTGPARDAMTAATTEAVEALHTMLATPTGSKTVTADSVRLAEEYLDQARTLYQAGQQFDDQSAARLILLLQLPPVHDGAARYITGEPWQIQMWTDLLRRAQPEHAAPPATLLTLTALRAGNGVLADLAVQRARQADPTDEFAEVLAQAVNAGISPATVAGLLGD